MRKRATFVWAWFTVLFMASFLVSFMASSHCGVCAELFK